MSVFDELRESLKSKTGMPAPEPQNVFDEIKKALSLIPEKEPLIKKQILPKEKVKELNKALKSLPVKTGDTTHQEIATGITTNIDPRTGEIYQLEKGELPREITEPYRFIPSPFPKPKDKYYKSKNFLQELSKTLQSIPKTPSDFILKTAGAIADPQNKTVDNLIDKTTAFGHGFAKEFALGMTKEPYEYLPRTGLDRVLHGVGEFAGFFGPAMIYGGGAGKLATQPVLAGLRRKFYGDILRKGLERMIREGIPLGLASSITEVGTPDDIKHMPERFVSGFLFGSVLGLNRLVDLKNHPALTQLLKQVSSRAMANALGLWSHEDFKDIVRGIALGEVSPNLEDKAFNELLLTWFSMKRPTRLEIKNFVGKVSKEIKSINKQAGKNITPPSVEGERVVTPAGDVIPIEKIEKGEIPRKEPDLSPTPKTVKTSVEYKIPQGFNKQGIKRSNNINKLINSIHHLVEQGYVFEYGHKHGNNAWVKIIAKNDAGNGRLIRVEKELPSRSGTSRGGRQSKKPVTNFVRKRGGINIDSIYDSGVGVEEAAGIWDSKQRYLIFKRKGGERLGNLAVDAYKAGLIPDESVVTLLEALNREFYMTPKRKAIEDSAGSRYMEGKELDDAELRMMEEMLIERERREQAQKERILEEKRKRMEIEEKEGLPPELLEKVTEDFTIENIDKIVRDRLGDIDKQISEALFKSARKVGVNNIYDFKLALDSAIESGELKNILENIKPQDISTESKYPPPVEGKEGRVSSSGEQTPRVFQTIKENLEKREKPSLEFVKEEKKDIDLSNIQMMDADILRLYGQSIGTVKKGTGKEIIKKLQSELPEKAEIVLSKATTRVTPDVFDTIDSIKKRAIEVYESWEKSEDPIDILTKMSDEEIFTPGLGIKKTSRVVKEEEFKFLDPEQERRWQEGKTIPQRTLLQSIGDFFKEAWYGITRTYINLPNTAEYVRAKDALKKLEVYRNVAADKIIRSMRGLTSKLTPGQYDLLSRKLFLEDLKETIELNPDLEYLPQKFTPETVRAEIKRVNSKISTDSTIQEAMNWTRRLRSKVIFDYIKAMNDIGIDVSKYFKRSNYFRHLVIDYLQNPPPKFGTGKRLKATTYRDFFKKRQGGLTGERAREYELAGKDISAPDIITDFITAEFNVLSQLVYDTKVAKTIAEIWSTYDISPMLKTRAKERNIKDWTVLIPDGYTEWQPQPGNIFYSTLSIPEKVIRKLMESQGVITGEELAEITKKVIALGPKRSSIVIPTELAKTLDNLKPNLPSDYNNFIPKLTLLWKQWILSAPRRAIKYNLRNLTGDAEGIFLGNPRGFKQVPRAVKDILYYFQNKWDALSPEFKDWFERGGMESTLQSIELPQIRQMEAFSKLYESNKPSNLNILKHWFKIAKGGANFREAILRYANYLNYLEQMKSNNGKPLNWGASKPEEIMALKDIRDRAWRLSNELLGAYDEVSHIGQWLRRHAVPFWSWNELNFRRTARLLLNSLRSEKDINKKLKALGLFTLKKSPFTMIRLGRFLLKASIPYLGLRYWNNVLHKEEEKSLPKDIRNRPHIIFGKTKRGEISYFSRIGALQDVLDWFGLDAIPEVIEDYRRGNKSLKEIALDITVKSPTNKLVQSVSPFWKIPAELISGQALFPDIYERRTIKNKIDHLMRSLDLHNEYRALTKVPGKPYKETLSEIFTYKVDPLESAYHEIYDLETDFLKKIGKGGQGGWLNPKSLALYNMKRAINYRDEEAKKYYFKKYLEYNLVPLGITKTPDEVISGIMKGIAQSLENMMPLSRLNKREKKVFLDELTPEEKEKLLMAYKYYDEKIIGIEEKEEDNAKR